MKKLIIILSILIIGFSSYAQDVIGGRIIAKNSLFVRDRWVDTITVDTSKFLNYNRSIPTAGAVYEFVNARMSGGGGGSGTVTSVGLTVPSFLSVSGSPVTTSGTLAVTLSGTALPAINGGTGQVSYAVGDLLYASTTTALSKLAASTSGFVLTANGAGVAPSWQAIPSDNLIVQNAGSGTQTWFTSGDTLYMKMIKNATITATTDTDSSLLLNVTDADRGDITVSSTGTVWTIDNDVVTFAKFQNITQARLLGRYTASTGDMQEISIGSGLALDAGTGILSATGGGSVTFETLSDGPGSFTGQSGKSVRVNVGETALEYYTPSGTGDVNKVGTPVNNQLGVWTGDGTIEGDANLTFASSTLNIGVAGAATGIFTQSGVTSGTITFQPASAAGTYTLTWPTNDGDADQVLTTNGAGVLSWTTSSGGGATTALDNLASVAINTSLISDADVTDNLGDATHNWNNVYLRSALFDGSTSGTITVTATATAGTNTITLPAGTGTVMLLGTNQGVTGDINFTGANTYGTVRTSSTSATSNFWAGTGSAASNLSSTASLQVEGSSAASVRSIFNGNTAYAMIANNYYSNVTVGNTALTEPSSGNVVLISSLVVRAPTITGGAGTVSNTATVYIDAAPSATVSGGTYALWAKAGNVEFTNGNLTLGTAGNKLNIATGSNASVGISGAMTAGSITISTTAVTANSIIQLTPVGAGTGQISIGTITAGTSFVINSSDGSDTRIVHWTIIN